MRLDGPGRDWERSEHGVGTSYGGAVYARAFTAPLLDLPRIRIAVVEDLSRKSEDRHARGLLLQELEGPVSIARLGEIKEELRDVIVSSPGRRGFRADPTAEEREGNLDRKFLPFSTDLALDRPEMYRTYFAMDAVEKALRTSKGDLSLEPVRYRRKDRLDAYATVVYVAFCSGVGRNGSCGKCSERHLSEALRALESVAWARSGPNKSVRERCARPTKGQKELFAARGARTYLLPKTAGRQVTCTKQKGARHALCRASPDPRAWVQASLRRPSSARVASRGLWAADPTLTLPSNGNCSPPFPAGGGPPGPGSPSFATRACPSGMRWDPARRRLQGFQRARLPPGRFRSMGKLVPHLRVSPGRVCRPTGRPMGPRSLLRLIGGSGLERS